MLPGARAGETKHHPPRPPRMLRSRLRPARPSRTGVADRYCTTKAQNRVFSPVQRSAKPSKGRSEPPYRSPERGYQGFLLRQPRSEPPRQGSEQGYFSREPGAGAGGPEDAASGRRAATPPYCRPLFKRAGGGPDRRSGWISALCWLARCAVCRAPSEVVRVAEI